MKCAENLTQLYFLHTFHCKSKVSIKYVLLTAHIDKLHISSPHFLEESSIFYSAIVIRKRVGGGRGWANTVHAAI